MGGSSGGGYDTYIPTWDDDPNKRLFIGATDSQPIASADYAPVMTPGQPGVGGFVAPTSDTGPGTGSNLTTTVQPTGTSGAKSFGDWLMSKEGAKALQDTGEKLKGPESGTKPPDPKINQAQLGGGSQVSPGSPNALMSLMQMLSQRRYSPIGYSGGGSTRGLMG